MELIAYLKLRSRSEELQDKSINSVGTLVESASLVGPVPCGEFLEGRKRIAVGRMSSSKR